MFTSVRRCAETMTQLRRLKVRVTVTGNGAYALHLLKPLEDYHNTLIRCPAQCEGVQNT